MRKLLEWFLQNTETYRLDNIWWKHCSRPSKSLGKIPEIGDFLLPRDRLVLAVISVTLWGRVTLWVIKLMCLYKRGRTVSSGHN